MDTESLKEEPTMTVPGDGGEQVAEALKLVSALEEMGFGRPKFNLQSPYNRRTVCTASKD